MYSGKKRKKAVNLLIKFEKSCAATIQRLGYPDPEMLKAWYRDYLKEKRTGIIRDKYKRKSKYTEKQKVAAVNHYLEHGRCNSRTARVIGYPSRETLRHWCHELVPGECKKRSGSIQYTYGQKGETREALCSRDSAAKELVQEQVEYYGLIEPRFRSQLSHLSGTTEPLLFCLKSLLNLVHYVRLVTNAGKLMSPNCEKYMSLGRLESRTLYVRVISHYSGSHL